MTDSFQTERTFVTGSGRQISAEEDSSPEAGPRRRYTADEVAGYLGVREDDLMVVLRNAALIFGAQSSVDFTRADINLLEQFIRSIRKFAAESVYGGGDL